MTLPTRLAALCIAALVGVGSALPQESKNAANEEDSRLDRLIEDWLRLNESEHEHVVREIMRGDAKATDDVNEWFKRLGGDDDQWDRTRIQRNSAREIFDRIAYRVDLKGTVLTRAQFTDYAKLHWRKDKSPPWRSQVSFETAAEAERLFKRLDRDRDGYLTAAEMSSALRADFKRWDQSGDGWINFDEYRVYFAYRLDRVYRGWVQRSERALPPLPISVPEDDDRPMVMRAAKLPIGLPAWFELLDADRDGQVALFEWRSVDWPLDEFMKLDLNNDGFLEPREILKLLSITERDNHRPFGYLLQKRLSSGGNKSRK